MPKPLQRPTSGSLLTVAVALAAGAAIWWLLPDEDTPVSVTVPELSPTAVAGQHAFAANCAQCHGQSAGGTDQGPPLIHQWYRPDHHADVAFFLAANRGVPQHHWNFGDMPPQPQIGERSMQQIVQFVRELQQANGVY